MLVRAAMCLALVSFSGQAASQGRDVDAEAVVQPWYNCVGYRFGQLSVRNANPVAIEAAFLDCRAEESRVRGWAERRGIRDGDIEMAIAHHRAKLKSALTSR